MRETTFRALPALLALLSMMGPAEAATNLWLHVTVDEGGGAKVTVNLPLALAERALPMIPMHEELRWRHHAGGHGLDLEEMRELWAEVRNSPDMTFVTAEDDGERVKVWKESDSVYVEVRAEDEETVDVQVPVAVVDALLAGDEIDFSAAVKALGERGGGNLVKVRDRDDTVRVWIDETPEAREGAR